MFDLYDIEDVGVLELRDLFKMMKEIHGREFNKNYAIQKYVLIIIIIIIIIILFILCSEHLKD